MICRKPRYRVSLAFIFEKLPLVNMLSGIRLSSNPKREGRVDVPFPIRAVL